MSLKADGQDENQQGENPQNNEGETPFDKESEGKMNEPLLLKPDNIINLDPAENSEAFNANPSLENAKEGEQTPFNGGSKTEEFNPDIHARNADGSPKLNQNGSFAKKRGRRANSTSSKSGNNQSETVELTPDIEQVTQEMIAIVTMISCGLGGPDGLPTKDETKALYHGLKPLAEKYPNFRFPAEIIALASVSQFFAIKAQNKTFEEKAVSKLLAIKEKLQSWFNRKKS